MSDAPPDPYPLGKASADVVREAWVAAGPKASGRKVADALVEQGYEISPSSVARCVRAGFRKFSWETNFSPMGVVKEAAIKPAPPDKVAAAVIEAMGEISEKDAGRLKEILGKDEATIRENMRKLHLAAGCLLAEDLATHTKLMMLAPEKAAKLYQALGEGIEPPTIPVAPPSDGSGARVIDGREIEQETISPSAIAIREFRRKQGLAA
jgi:hypothetical protein